MRRHPFYERRIVLDEHDGGLVPQQHILDLFTGIDVDKVQRLVPKQRRIYGIVPKEFQMTEDNLLVAWFGGYIPPNKESIRYGAQSESHDDVVQVPAMETRQDVYVFSSSF